MLALQVDELPALLLEGDLGVELVFLDLALLLDGRGAAGRDGHVGLAQEGLAILGLERLGDLGRRLGRDEIDAQKLGPQRIEQGRILDPLLDARAAIVSYCDRTSSSDRFWISVRVSIWIMLVIRCASRSGSLERCLCVAGSIVKFSSSAARLGFVDSVGELALDGHRLEIAGHLVEHQVGVHAAGRHGHDLGVVLEVEERQALSLADDPPRAVLDDVFGGLSLEVSGHGSSMASSLGFGREMSYTK